MINRDQPVFVLVGARVYEVTRAFAGHDAEHRANAFTATNPEHGVISVNKTDHDEIIYLARLDDKGRTP